MFYKLLPALFSVSFVTTVTVSSPPLGTENFKLTKFQPCDASIDYPITFQVSLKNGDNGVQLMTSEGIFKVPLGENSDYNITIERKKTKDATENFKPLITLYDESTCEALEKYLGKFIREIEKAANLEPGSCPVPKGSYKVTDYPLDFKKLSFQSFPEGILRSTHVITNLKTKELLTCFEAEVENFPQ